MENTRFVSRVMYDNNVYLLAVSENGVTVRPEKPNPDISLNEIIRMICSSKRICRMMKNHSSKARYAITKNPHKGKEPTVIQFSRVETINKNEVYIPVYDIAKADYKEPFKEYFFSKDAVAFLINEEQFPPELLQKIMKIRFIPPLQDYDGLDFYSDDWLAIAW